MTQKHNQQGLKEVEPMLEAKGMQYIPQYEVKEDKYLLTMFYTEIKDNFKYYQNPMQRFSHQTGICVLKTVLYLTLLLSLILPTSNYPTNYQLSQSSYISIQPHTINIDNSSISPYLFIDDNNTVVNFLSSNLRTLQPLICINKLQDFRIQSVENVIFFRVVVENVTVGINDTMYGLKAWTRDVKISTMDIKVIFFSKSIQDWNLLNPTALFYSFNTKVDTIFRQNSHSYKPINIILPIQLLNASFTLADPSYGNYKQIFYMTGLDLQSQCSITGINPIVNITSQTILELNLQIFGDSCSSGVGQIILRSLSLSIFIYNPSKLQNTEIFIDNHGLQLNYVGGLVYPTDDYNSFRYTKNQPAGNPLAIPTDSFISGLKYFKLYNTQKFSFEIKSYNPSLSSASLDYKKINFQVKSLQGDNTFLQLGGYLFLFAQVKCKGTNYVLKNDQTQCMPNTSCVNVDPAPTLYTFTKFSNYVCISCHYSCQTCLNGASCNTCNPSNYRYPNLTLGGYCYPMFKHYDDGTNQMAPQCDSNCLQCQIVATNCIACLPSRALIITSVHNSYNYCIECTQYHPNCTKCTSLQCLECGNNQIWIQNMCRSVNSISDSIWDRRHGQQCYNGNNSYLDGCDNFSKIVPGFQCFEEYQQSSQPSVCFYTKPLSLSLKSIAKQQFSNTLTIKYHFTATYWNQSTQINKIISLETDQQMWNIGSSLVFDYNPQAQQLTIVICYPTVSIENKSLSIEVDFMKLRIKQLGNQPILTHKIIFTPNVIKQAYFMINHSDITYKQAQSLANWYLVASLAGLAFMVTGILGGKYIVLQLVSVLQIVYIGLFQIDRYTPLYLAVNRLAPIVLTTSYDGSQIQKLNTLGLGIDFFSNYLFHFIPFILCIIIGSILIIISKINESQKALLMNLAGINCFGQYSLYSLLIFGYFGSFSLGLQIKYQLLDNNLELTLHNASLVAGILYILVMLGYLVAYHCNAKYFGQFYRQMQKFNISQKYVIMFSLQKIAVGLLLGLMADFKYIGFVLASIQAFVAIIVFFIQPFHKRTNNDRTVMNYSAMICVLIIYNIQKLYSQDIMKIDTNQWFYKWPNIIIFVIYFLIVFNLTFLIRQIFVCFERLRNIKATLMEFKEYYVKRSKNQKVDQNGKPSLFCNVPQKVYLTAEQLKIWRKLEQIKSSSRQFQKKFQRNLQTGGFKQQIIGSGFKTTKQLKRLQDNINKRKKKLNVQDIQIVQQGDDQQLQNLEQSKKTRQNADGSCSDQQQKSDRSLISKIQNKQNKVDQQNISEISQYQSRIMRLGAQTPKRQMLAENNQYMKIGQPQNSNLYQQDEQQMNRMQQNRKQKQSDQQRFKRQMEKLNDQLYFKIKKNDNTKKNLKPMTKQQYDQKVKKMSFFQHWDQIDQNNQKFQYLDQHENNNMQDSNGINKSNDKSNPCKFQYNQIYQKTKQVDQWKEYNHKDLKVTQNVIIPLKNSHIYKHSSLMKYPKFQQKQQESIFTANQKKQSQKKKQKQKQKRIIQAQYKNANDSYFNPKVSQNDLNKK